MRRSHGLGRDAGHVSALAAPPAEAGIPVAPAAVLIADCARRIVHLEGGAFDAHGLDTEGWIGQPIEQVLPPEAVPILLPRYEAALGGEPQAFEYSDPRRHAHRIPCSWFRFPTPRARSARWWRSCGTSPTA